MPCHRSRWSITAAAPELSTTTSRSPTVSRPRRQLPAPSTCRASGHCRIQPSTSWTMESASFQSIRAWAGSFANAMLSRIVACVLAPKPFTDSTRFSRQACSSASSESIPSASTSCFTFFGPSPGTRISSKAAAGTWTFSSSSRGSLPVSSSSSILPARSSPMPSRSVRDRVVSARTAANGSTSPPMVWAALR